MLKKALGRAGVLMMVIVVALAAVVIGTVVLPTGPDRRKTVSIGETTSMLTSELRKIPQSTNVLGKPSAPVTREVFENLQCLSCQQLTLMALPAIVEKWVASGRMQMEYVSMQTRTSEPEAFERQEVAALAAGQQEKMWNFIEAFYSDQRDFGSQEATNLESVAEQVPGLNIAQWNRDRRDRRLARRLAREQEMAVDADVGPAPALLIGRTGGAMELFNASEVSEEAFNETVGRLLKEN